jgi:6-pyruvoyl-tetrahydropterin synthase
MDWNIVLWYLFNNIAPEFYFAFYIFSQLGMTFSMLIDFQRLKSRKKKSNEKIKFDFKYWIKKNTIRMLTNYIAIFIIIRFPEKLKIASELSMFIAFVSGMSIDVIISVIKTLKLGSQE